MPYLLLADIVVVLHLGFILFVLFGGLLLLRWRWMIWLHLPALAWGLLTLIYQLVCPLTPLENWLLLQGGGQTYHGGFISHYLIPIIYTPGTHLPVSVNTLLIASTLLINGLVYAGRIVQLFRALQRKTS